MERVQARHPGDGDPRPARSRWRVPLVVVGVLALAAAAIVVLTRAGGDAEDDRPAATKPDTFTDVCITAIGRSWPAGEQDWTAGAFATDGEVSVATIRGGDRTVVCEGVPGPDGLPRVGPLISTRRAEPSDVPDLWLLPFSNVGMRPPGYPLILGGVVSGRASGMTVALRDGTTVEADVADGTVMALARWHGRSTTDVWTEEMTAGVMAELIVSVRVVDADGDVLYEGPPA